MKDRTENRVEVPVDRSDEPCADVAKPKKTDAIDDLLGGLRTDMEKMGVRTTAKGHCASCGKCIVGKVKKAFSVDTFCADGVKRLTQFHQEVFPQFHQLDMTFHKGTENDY